MSRLHIVRSLMYVDLVPVMLDALLTGTAARVTSAKLSGDFGPPCGEPIHAVLTSPSLIPPPVSRIYPAKVIVGLEVVEEEMQILEGVSYASWMFGGTVPDGFIRVQQSDTVKFHLKNHPSSRIPHSIDLHGVTGPGGGAASNFTAPSHESRLIFKALNEGIYVYHCATAPAGVYIANGMHGLILVEPLEDLPKVDHEYYVMQSDFYTAGKCHEKGLQPFGMEKAIDERSSYVLFNGTEGTLTGGKALHAKVGETARILVGNGGSSLVSSSHAIGTVFDQVCYEGGTNVQKGVQTTPIPAGGVAVVKFITRASGNYVLVNHSIFRVLNKDAMATLKTNGTENKLVYSGKELGPVYLDDRTAPNTNAVIKVAQTSMSGILTVQGQVQTGRVLFAGTCSVCHQGNGTGLPSVFPLLAKSGFLAADPKRATNTVLRSLNGKIKVNGQEYDSAMPSMTQLNDGEVTNILAHVLNSWDNPDGRVSTESARKVYTQPTPAKTTAEH